MGMARLKYWLRYGVAGVLGLVLLAVLAGLGGRGMLIIMLICAAG